MVHLAIFIRGVCVLAIVVKWVLMVFAVMNYLKKVCPKEQSPPEEQSSAEGQFPKNLKKAAPLTPVSTPTKVARVLPLRRVAKKKTTPWRTWGQWYLCIVIRVYMWGFGQGAVGMWGVCWPQVAYDIGDSKHVRGMLAKVLTVLNVLTVLINNKNKVQSSWPQNSKLVPNQAFKE